MMALGRASIFRRLLLAISGTALLAAMVSGAAHYLFTRKAINASLQSELSSALKTTLDTLEREYAVPVSADLRRAGGSPAATVLLASPHAQPAGARLDAQRLLWKLYRSRPQLYRALVLVDPVGRVRAAVTGNGQDGPDSDVEDAWRAELATRLAGTTVGTVRYGGPLRHADGGFSILAGITLGDAEPAGALIATVSMHHFVQHLREMQLLGHPSAWLLDRDGHVLIRPPGEHPGVDVAAILADAPVAHDSVVASSGSGGDTSPGGLFRIALCMPPGAMAAGMGATLATTLVVLGLVFLGACLLAVVLARQIATPIRALARLADTVSDGDLTKRIDAEWVGEAGRLARAFNRMLDALRATTVSRAYVNAMVDSMSDAVIVVDQAGVIETLNLAAERLLGHDGQTIVGERLEPLLPEEHARASLRIALVGRRALDNVPMSMTGPDGEELSLWLSASPMVGPDPDLSGMVVVARDVTHHILAQRDLEHAHHELNFHVTNSPLAVVEWDSQLRVQRWTGRATELFGWRAEEVLGKRHEEWGFVLEEDVETAMNAIRQLPDGEARSVVRVRNHCKDGTVVHCEWHHSLLRDEHGEPRSVLSLGQDITESARLSEELSHQASHDALTGLANRREFERVLTGAIAQAREGTACHALAFVDMDQFKLVNDSCGHAAGDELLCQLAGVLRRNVRKYDLVARLGGDEFAILMHHCDKEPAAAVLRALLADLRDYPFLWDGKTFRVTASIGLVSIDTCVVDMASVMSAADAACMAAKNEGRDRLQVFDERDDLMRRRGEAQWVSRINHALEEDRFFLMAQPIARALGDGPESVERIEVLVRMTDEEGRVVMPGAFLPAAERYHLMPKLDRWVIRNTISMLARAAPVAGVRRMCFVNLSGQSLADESLRDFVAVQFERTGLDPGSVCFEITETAAVADFARANAFIKSLSELGCRFALDDFGAGVSSFAYLKNLPVHMLKIDGMFVRDVATDPTSLALVRSINEVGHAMGKQTVAEFVEDEAILERLRELGVDFVQGYHVGRPVLAESLLDPVAAPLQAAG